MADDNFDEVASEKSDDPYNGVAELPELLKNSSQNFLIRHINIKMNQPMCCDQDLTEYESPLQISQKVLTPSQKKVKTQKTVS